jgi:hypothetical protein
MAKHVCDKDPCIQRFDRLDQKLDAIDSKLDNHLERIAKAESWIKGHTTILVFTGTALLSIFGVVINLLLRK